MVPLSSLWIPIVLGAVLVVVGVWDLANNLDLILA